MGCAGRAELGLTPGREESLGRASCPGCRQASLEPAVLAQSRVLQLISSFVSHHGAAPTQHRTATSYSNSSGLHEKLEAKSLGFGTRKLPGLPGLALLGAGTSQPGCSRADESKARL